jgi:peptidoglycan/xylan/chitin deacetylase (PgdA/CDA1 family)
MVLNKEMIKRRGVLNYLLRLFNEKGVYDVTRKLNPRALTVLNYHRINDIHQDAFYTFRPNVSAARDGFAQQMEYVKANYNLIKCEQLAAWLKGKFELPPHAALVTFDDGYYDNLANAYPVLRALSIPAIIFLTTDFIGAKIPLYWDYVAYCFSQTEKDSVYLPIVGSVSWSTEEERDIVLSNWVNELKAIPDVEKREIVSGLANLLNVTISEDAFSDLYLDWDQVRQLNQDGIEFGSHTMGHPILTRVDLAQVEAELMKSKKKIEDEIGSAVFAFAYPNGQKDDFSPEIINLVQKSGMEIAFSLLPGPTWYSTVRKNPFAIRRIYIGNKDTFPRFVAKLNGVSRFVDW